MGIADADRVRVAEGDASRLCRRPRADPGDRLETSPSLRRGERDPGIDPIAVSTDTAQQLGPAPLQPERVEFEVGE